MWVEKNGPNWRIRDLVHGKKITVKSGFPTKTAAKKVMTVLESEQIQGTYIDPRGGRMLVSQWAATWWPTHEIGLVPSSRKSEGARLRNHVLPLLGDLELAEVDRLTVTGWVAQLIAGDPEDEDFNRVPLAEKSIRNVHGVFYSLMQAAVDNRLIRSNPCYRTGLPKIQYKERRYLDDAEVGRLVAAMPPHWQPMLVLMIATGVRWSEAAGLRVKWLDPLGRTLRVEETRHELSGGSPLVIGPPKTVHSRRTVTYPPEVAELLVPLVSMRHRDEHVFTAADGTELRQRKFWKGVWLRATAAAGLEGLRIHDLRHTHAAALISDGIPLTGIQRRLGHSSISVTSDMYGHLLPVVDENIIASASKSLGKVDFAALVGEPAGETSREEQGPTRTYGGERAGQSVS
jgi:integrase